MGRWWWISSYFKKTKLLTRWWINTNSFLKCKLPSFSKWRLFTSLILWFKRYLILIRIIWRAINKIVRGGSRRSRWRSWIIIIRIRIIKQFRTRRWKIVLNCFWKPYRRRSRIGKITLNCFYRVKCCLW